MAFSFPQCSATHSASKPRTTGCLANHPRLKEQNDGIDFGAEQAVKGDGQPGISSWCFGGPASCISALCQMNAVTLVAVDQVLCCRWMQVEALFIFHYTRKEWPASLWVLPALSVNLGRLFLP